MDLPHMATCLAIEANVGRSPQVPTFDPYDRLIETIADLEKAKSAVDRALYLLYEMRASHPRNSYK